MNRKTRAPAATPPKPQAPVAEPVVEAAAKVEAMAKVQPTLPSGEAFWKSAGRFCRLR